MYGLRLTVGYRFFSLLANRFPDVNHELLEIAHALIKHRMPYEALPFVDGPPDATRPIAKGIESVHCAIQTGLTGFEIPTTINGHKIAESDMLYRGRECRGKGMASGS